MTLQSTKIKPSQLVKRVVKLFTGVSDEHSQMKSLYDTIWNNIKEGLDYGFDIEYNTLSGDIYKQSLEGNYREYFGKEPTKEALEQIYNVLTTTIIPNYINKDIEFTTGVGEFGKTFTLTTK